MENIIGQGVGTIRWGVRYASVFCLVMVITQIYTCDNIAEILTLCAEEYV